MVSDVLVTSKRLIQEANPPGSVEDIRALGRPVVQFSDTLWADLKLIRKFLFTRMYRAPSVVEMRKRVTAVVEDLFPLFLAQPELMPADWRADLERARGDDIAMARLVADYIAGMTDRFALQTHDRLTARA